MSRRNSLPSSLELLLDTMCNTFGGIVFIAIALVIITQESQKLLTAMAAARWTPEAKQALRDQNRQLEAEIAELRAKLQEEALRAKRCSPEKRKNIEALLQARLDLLAAQAKLDATADEFAKLRAEQSKMANQLDEARRQLEKLKEQYQQMEELAQPATDSLAELEKKANQLMKENRVLEEEAENAQEVFTIAFSRESSTPSGLRQVVVLIRKGRIYVDDVNLSWRERFDNVLEPNFKGNGFSADPADLQRGLGSLRNSSNYVELYADAQSFDALVVLRQWLREHRFKVAWHCADDFRFYKGGGSSNNTSF